MKDYLLDLAAYVVVVAGKPLPYIAGGVVVAVFFEHLAVLKDTWPTIGITFLLVSGASLASLPVLLWVRRKAEERYKDDATLWLPAVVVGGLSISIYAALMQGIL